jgi:hypothetical protein
LRLVFGKYHYRQLETFGSNQATICVMLDDIRTKLDHVYKPPGVSEGVAKKFPLATFA